MTGPRNPWIQTASGRAFDLVRPVAAEVDLHVDVAEALARTPRFGGHVRGGAYSVAQHCVIGADALLRQHGPAVAAAFLLHDAHEAYIGDRATPVGAALGVYAGAMARGSKVLSPVGADAASCAARAIVAQAWDGMRASLDRAIHEAAGLAWPLDETTRAIVLAMDLRMLATERRHLLGASPAPWGETFDRAEPLRLGGKMTVWPWPDAADEYRTRLTQFLPRRARAA